MSAFEKLSTLYKLFFHRYKQSYYSQSGEDVVLNNWIRKDIKRGFFVDVGCYHPKKFSNTYFLYKRGWRGVNIDLEQSKIDWMNKFRKEDINVLAAVSDKATEVMIYTDSKYSLGSFISASSVVFKNYYHAGKIITKTLNQILDATKYKNQEIDLLSIDVEGHDFNVLLSLNIYKYKPKIILIESPLRDINKIVSSELYGFLSNNKYELVNWVGYTLFFINPKKAWPLLNMDHPEFRALAEANQRHVYGIKKF